MIESDKRKELLRTGKIIESVSSSKELKINRFDLTGKKSIHLTHYIENKNLLFELYQKNIDV